MSSGCSMTVRWPARKRRCPAWCNSLSCAMHTRPGCQLPTNRRLLRAIVQPSIHVEIRYPGQSWQQSSWLLKSLTLCKCQFEPSQVYLRLRVCCARPNRIIDQITPAGADVCCIAGTSACLHYLSVKCTCSMRHQAGRFNAWRVNKTIWLDEFGAALHDCALR